MYILGLTTLGDSAASLIKDGELVAAVEEECFARDISAVIPFAAR